MNNSASRKFSPPPLTRSTAWTAERIAGLSIAEIRSLSANATRMDEAAVVALCTEALSKRSKKSAAARKTAKK